MAEFERLSSVLPAASGQRPAGVVGDCGECPRCGVPMEFDHVRQLLRGHGCCVCGDAGFVRDGTLRPGEREFGKAQVCGCRSQRPAASSQQSAASDEETFARRSRVPARYLQRSIESWEPASGIPRMEAASYVSSWPPQRPILFLTGEKGTGKTHLACGIIRALWELHGKLGRFWPVIDLLDRYKATFDEDRARESVESIDAEMRRCDLIVLDDLGAQKGTDFAEERLFRLIDERARDLRPLVVTSNVAVERLAGRVSSRLADREYGRVVLFEGRDRRVFGA